MPGYLKILFSALWLTLPLSVEIPVGYGAQITAPAEILIAIIGVVLLFEVPMTQLKGQVKTMALPAVWLLWGWICAFSSAMPMVSFKYMVVTTAYCWVFFVPVICWPQAPWEQWLKYFAITTGMVVLWTIFRHGVYFSFRADQANLAPMPFFDDHTVYAALLSMLLFGVAALVRPFKHEWVISGKTLLMVLLGSGILLSTSRGAWLSVAVAGGWLLLVQKKRLGLLLGGIALVFTFVFISKTDFTAYLQRDVSTAERLNRYDAAWQMVQERPVTGFGPGTFQFQYIPFQRPEKMTRISVSSPIFERNPSNYGRGGGAHSEYFRALAETGWPGLVFIILLLGLVFWRALRVIKKRISATHVLFAALFTFCLHGVLNDFFHDSRIAAMVWLIIAKIVWKGDDNPAFTSKEKI